MNWTNLISPFHEILVLTNTILHKERQLVRILQGTVVLGKLHPSRLDTTEQTYASAAQVSAATRPTDRAKSARGTKERILKCCGIEIMVSPE
jgi:hypothetical protein